MFFLDSERGNWEEKQSPSHQEDLRVSRQAGRDAQGKVTRHQIQVKEQRCECSWFFCMHQTELLPGQ